MSSKKITPVISKIAYERLTAISKNRDTTLSDATREIIDLGLDTYEQKFKNGFEPFGKNSITRAERIGIFSAILSHLILRKQVNDESLAELKELAKEIMNERWDYFDEK